MVKRTVTLILVILSTLLGAILFSSCGLGKDDSKIYIIPEEEFKSTVKLDDDGNIEKLVFKKLEKADVQTLITGEKYYAVVYVDSKKISQGDIGIYNDVLVNEDEFYYGAKKNVDLYANLNYNDSPSSGMPYASVRVKQEGNKKTDSYYAIGFTAENADDERFFVNMMYYQGSHHRDFSTHKKVYYNKQITATPSIKYLNYNDYMGGAYDDKLTDNISAPLYEKLFVVVDYNLSSFKDIEETDTATVTINAKFDSEFGYNMRVEELPTADYTYVDNTVTASFKLRDGGEAGKNYRFIISITSDVGVSIDITSEITAKKITFLNQKSVSSKANISSYFVADSKLDFELSSDSLYYIVTGIGNDKSDRIVIPETYNGKPVKSIANDAFINQDHIREVILPSSLKSIGDRAFKDCTGLYSIIIPTTVTSIGDEAFAGCSTIIINCKAKTKPDGWSESWADTSATVFWEYK